MMWMETFAARSHVAWRGVGWASLLGCGLAFATWSRVDWITVGAAQRTPSLVPVGRVSECGRG